MEIITAKSVNLTNCDREQIHIPGAIQPHGLLMIIDAEPLTLLATSANGHDFLGMELDPFLGQPVSKLLGESTVEKIHQCLAGDFEGINPLRILIAGQIFNGIVHQQAELIVLELERTSEAQVGNFFGFYNMTRGIIAEIQQASDLSALVQIIVTNIRRLTGFDRVMVYRFDEDDSGHVIAESKQDYLEPFLGLHYPSTDVPGPARRLYKLNYIRSIVDVDYQEVAVPPHPYTGETIDLSFSVLRSVSPIHLEYLHHMQVQASTSISLIYENRLWGLIACHHYSGPKFVPYEIRTACEFLGQVMSLELAAKEENENIDYKVQIKTLLGQLLKPLSQAHDLSEELIDHHEQLQALVNAHGLAIIQGDEVHLRGATPTRKDLDPLISWLIPQIESDLFYSDRLPLIYEPAQEFKAIASGILMLSLNKVQNHYILWFRPEVIQTVDWAGNPNKNAVIEEDGSITLSPRKSFEQWKEQIQGRSIPWLQCEIQQVMELRILIVEILFKKAQDLSLLNRELLRSNEELDSFAYIASHDLKEPLRGIYNYSQFLLEDYGEILDPDGQTKLETLVVLTKRMENLINSLLYYSRLGRREVELQSLNLQGVINNIQTILQASDKQQLEIKVPRTLPTILGDENLIPEIFTNLITNAYKYNEAEAKWVEIGYVDLTPELIKQYNLPPHHGIIYVKDNGIGIREKHLDLVFPIFKRLHSQEKYGGGTGAGLTIVKKIIERHNQKIWIESEYGQGTTFYMTFAIEHSQH
ncbi:MAG: GAF domain-containing protein [Synechococcaceae cyanobacterium RL_1_2]|nr:GAF domain-containing protein [Synechococcaceae cyanobacterium RL_1_2]